MRCYTTSLRDKVFEFLIILAIVKHCLKVYINLIMLNCGKRFLVGL